MSSDWVVKDNGTWTRACIILYLTQCMRTSRVPVEICIARSAAGEAGSEALHYKTG